MGDDMSGQDEMTLIGGGAKLPRTLISATLIAKNEAHNVERCLDSIWPHVDQVVVADTGSTDGTIAALRFYAKAKKQSGKLKIIRFKWVDDFAAARNAADDAATGEWLVWADFDDTVHGLENLRRMVEEAASDVQAYFCHYDYAKDPDGNTVSELWRERVVRRLPWRWEDRLHEYKVFTHGQIVRVDPSIARWEHHHERDITHTERNLRILEAWDEDEPNQPRVLWATGMEYMGLERTQDAVDTFRRYLAMEDREGPDVAQRRAQAARHLAVNLMLLGRPQDAYDLSWRALSELWDWPDTHLSLAEICETLGDPKRGYQHALSALQMGKPDSMLILNPVQYTAHPRAVMAVCAARMNKLDEAISLAEQALEISPTNALMTANIDHWRAARQQQQTVDRFLELAQLNVAADEALKAKQLLDSVPFSITDDKRIIDMRASVAAAIAKAAEPIPEAESAAAKFRERHADAKGWPYLRVVPEGTTGTGRLKAARMMDVAAELQQQGVIDEIGVTDDRWIVAAATPLKRPRKGTVAIWTGYAIGPWHPSDITQRGLGGSETAAVRLAEELASMGYAVSLYGQFEDEDVIGDVLLRDFRRFDPTKPLDVFVGFRDAQRFDHPVNAKTSVLWLEDLPGAERLNNARMQNIDFVAGVSGWHRQAILEYYPWLDPNHVIAGRNGITHQFFETEPAPERELRVLYTSSPDRGVDVVLECWPRVVERVPGAQLVTTYSRWYDLVAQSNPVAGRFRAHVTELLKQPNVRRINGGLGQGHLAHLMRSSLVWCHPSWYSDAGFAFHETSCISAMEAQAAGLAVVASNWGALTETVQHGVLIDGDPAVDGSWRDQFVDGIVAGLTDTLTQEAAQTIGPEMVRNMDWRGAAEQLASLFGREERKAA